MSVGWNVKWCPVSRITTLLARKRPFHWIRWRVGSWGPPGKLQNFKTDDFSLIVVDIIWLKYWRYGVKHYPINQSINIPILTDILMWRPYSDILRHERQLYHNFTIFMTVLTNLVVSLPWNLWLSWATTTFVSRYCLVDLGRIRLFSSTSIR